MRYAVKMLAELTIEIEANSADSARLAIFEAFGSRRGYDPLAETRISLENVLGFNAVLKTTVSTAAAWHYLDAELA